MKGLSTRSDMAAMWLSYRTSSIAKSLYLCKVSYKHFNLANSAKFIALWHLTHDRSIAVMKRKRVVIAIVGTNPHNSLTIFEIPSDIQHFVKMTFTSDATSKCESRYFYSQSQLNLPSCVVKASSL